MNSVQKKMLQKGEPAFGSVYDEKEASVVNKIIKESIKPELVSKLQKKFKALKVSF
jgi:hypothetical protein